MRMNGRRWVLGLARGAFWCALAVLLYMAVARPMPGGQAGVLSVHDKLVHGFVYGSLTSIGLFGRLGTSLVLLVLVSHGALVEVLQGLMSERTADVLDLLANCAGIATVLLIWCVGMKVLRLWQQAE